jgi:hypothetical protein
MQSSRLVGQSVEACGSYVADSGFNTVPHSRRAVVAHAGTDFGVLRRLGFRPGAMNIDKLASEFDKG